VSALLFEAGAQNAREAWVARYDGGGCSVDHASALTVDSAGNVYVTGYSRGIGTEYDYTTIKYDANGNIVWIARYDGTGNSNDQPRAIAVDSRGNVYVTGVSIGAGTDWDYATVKYDANGNLLWVARYNGFGSGIDLVHALGVDSQGNVYVTGASAGSGTSFDYATVKYDANGNQLWVARYNGPGNRSDYALALAVDGRGDVYVTGYSFGAGTKSDYATVKYDANGNQLWVARYNGRENDPFFSDDIATAIATDSQGNVYVTGYSRGADFDTDYLTIKYDANGNRLWAVRYDGPDNGGDLAKSIAVDSQGNVYVAGNSARNAHLDYATVKYDANGNQLWDARYMSSGYDVSEVSGMTLDSQGNIYVTGFISDLNSGQDYATVKYDANGNQLWDARYSGAGNGNDKAYGLAVDNQGHVYVTGASWGESLGFDYATVKYDANGNPLWVNRYDGRGSSTDVAYATAVDDQGNVYVAGYSDRSDTGRDYTTAKYDANGNLLWVRRYNGSGNRDDEARAIAVDGQGNVYVTGYAWENLGMELVTMKYDTNGALLWINRLATQLDELVLAIRVDSLGNVYVAGTSFSSVNWNYLTVKYDTSGNRLWLRTYNGSGDGDDRARSIAVDDLGNVYVTGYSVGAGTGRDYATVKYDANGNLLWVARYHSAGNRNDEAYAVAVDGGGHVYVTGYSVGAGTGRDYATVKYDANGNLLWVARYHSAGSANDEAFALALDSQGNAYVTGYSTGAGTGRDFLTIKYSADGAPLWARRYNGAANNDDVASAIVVDSLGNVSVTGYSTGVGTGRDYATLQYDANGNRLWLKRYNGTGNRNDEARALAVDRFGNVYVTGLSVSADTGIDYAIVKYVQTPVGDVDGDGCVNDSDLMQVLSAFGQSRPDLPEDQNGDDVVDDADLLAVLFNFGSGC